MRRILTLILLAAICCTVPLRAEAESLDAFIKRFKKCEKAEYQRISGMMIGLMRMMMPKDLSKVEELPEEELNKILEKEGMSKEEFMEMTHFMSLFLNHIKSMSMLSLEECSEADRQAFITAGKGWIPDGFTLDEEESDETDRCFVKTKDGTITELVLLSTEECSLITMKGNLDVEFIKNAEQTFQFFEQTETNNK